MKLHNTLTGTKDILQPLEERVVKLYTCGLTVYSQPHIGNWLGYIYWDVLVRTLRAKDYTVLHTQNITDVGHLVSDGDEGEDKMEKGARQEGTTAWYVAKKFSAIAEHEAYEFLGLLRPTNLVPATSCIDKQIAFAQVLEEKGYLYEIPGNGMYFDTSKLDDYGKLAKLDIAGLEAGARVATEGKRNTTDFAVWKFSPKDTRRDMEWESPWGKGFPGWHLECSVIARETLGDQIDIHTGGIDHIPVHHTNEIAQTETVTGTSFSNIWLHNNHIKVDGTKISKSLGNIYTLQDIIDHGYTMDDYKVMALSKHYRTEGNFTWDILAAAHNRLQRWKEAAALRWQTSSPSTPSDTNLAEQSTEYATKLHDQMLQDLADDLDTPQALMHIDTVVDEILAKPHMAAITEVFTAIDDLLGLRIIANTPDIPVEVAKLIAQRQAARSAKDWSESDRLRDEIARHGVQVNDTANGTVWSYI